MFEGHR